MPLRRSMRPALRRGATVLLFVLAGLIPALGQPIQDSAHSGERMYREGILPSGKPMSARPQDGSALSGSAFACAGCHLGAGTGNADERIVVPPIHAPRLFQASFRYYPNLTLQERAELLPEVARTPLRRPAYTEATLTAALRDGVDPTGHLLNPVMPRYQLTDREAESLISYLKTLSLDLSPGVTGTTLSFATVVTEGVPQEDRDALLATLQREVAAHNQVYERSLKKPVWLVPMKEMALALRRWTLAVWVLKGPPATWPAQLEGHYQAGPVFALVGGITKGNWHPVHAFCESRGIPCILPLTEFPVISPAGGHTLYFSGGFYQEGATAGDHVADTLEDLRGKTVILVAQDNPKARELSRGFRDALAKRGVSKAVEVMVPAEGISAPFLSELLLDNHGEATLVLWAGRETFPALGEVAAGAVKPAHVFMSASYLREAVWDLPQMARPFTLLTYPYRLLKPEYTLQRSSDPAPVPFITAGDEHRVRSRTHTLMQVVEEGIRRMGRDFYRDNFLDRIGLMDDKQDSDFPVLRFSPGLPWLSTGCLLVRVSPGALHAFSNPTDGTLR